MAFSLKSGVSTPVALVGGTIGVGIVIYALWNGGAAPEDDAGSAVTQAEQSAETVSQTAPAQDVKPEPEVVAVESAPAEPEPEPEPETVEAETVEPVTDDAVAAAEPVEEPAEEEVVAGAPAVEDAETEQTVETVDTGETEESLVVDETATTDAADSTEADEAVAEKTVEEPGDVQEETADAEAADMSGDESNVSEVANSDAPPEVEAATEDAVVAEDSEEPAVPVETVSEADTTETTEAPVEEPSDDVSTDDSAQSEQAAAVEAQVEVAEPVVEIDTAVPAIVETTVNDTAQAEDTAPAEPVVETAQAEEDVADATLALAEDAPEPALEPMPEPEPVAIAPDVDVAAPEIADSAPAPADTTSDTELASLQPVERDETVSNPAATIPEPVAADAVTDQIEPNTRQPTAIVMAPQVSEGAGIAAPQFDLVRVDKSGSTVVAGRAEPNTEVAILQNGQTVATVTASSRGEFVALFETDVEEQAQSLELASRATVDGPQVFSESSVIVLGRDLPEIEGTSSDVSADVAPAVIQATPEAVRVLQPVIGLADLEAVSLDSISYNASGDVVLAGRGRPKNTARAYVNGKIQGETTISDQGSWRVTLDGLQAGRYVLRIDEVAPDGAVVSRVESPFQRVYPTAENLEALSSERQVVIQRGDNLWNIARVRYGDGFMYTVIYDANTDQIRDPDLIYPGQIFDMPKEGADAN